MTAPRRETPAVGAGWISAARRPLECAHGRSGEPRPPGPGHRQLLGPTDTGFALTVMAALRRAAESGHGHGTTAHIRAGAVAPPGRDSDSDATGPGPAGPGHTRDTHTHTVTKHGCEKCLGPQKPERFEKFMNFEQTDSFLAPFSIQLIMVGTVRANLLITLRFRRQR